MRPKQDQQDKVLDTGNEIVNYGSALGMHSEEFVHKEKNIDKRYEARR